MRHGTGRVMRAAACGLTAVVLAACGSGGGGGEGSDVPAALTTGDRFDFVGTPGLVSVTIETETLATVETEAATGLASFEYTPSAVRLAQLTLEVLDADQITIDLISADISLTFSAPGNGIAAANLVDGAAAATSVTGPFGFTDN